MPYFTVFLVLDNSLSLSLAELNFLLFSKCLNLILINQHEWRLLVHDRHLTNISNVSCDVWRLWQLRGHRSTLGGGLYGRPLNMRDQQRGSLMVVDRSKVSQALFGVTLYCPNVLYLCFIANSNNCSPALHLGLETSHKL